MENYPRKGSRMVWESVRKGEKTLRRKREKETYKNGKRKGAKDIRNEI